MLTIDQQTAACELAMSYWRAVIDERADPKLKYFDPLESEFQKWKLRHDCLVIEQQEQLTSSKPSNNLSNERILTK